MSQDFSDTPVIAEYNEGTDFAPQPAYMNQLPMSLWNVALEAHSGRIFIGSIATYIFIFVMGILAVWCLWSGYVIRLVKKNKKVLMRCFNSHIAILYVQMVDNQRKVRMAILGKAPGIAIYCYSEK